MNPDNLGQFLRQKFEVGLEIIFPQTCAFCRAVCVPVPNFPGICRLCLARLPMRTGHESKLDLTKIETSMPLPPMNVYCAAKYQDPLREALLRLKFGDAPDLAPALSSLLIQQIYQNNLTFRAVAAVPLHPERLRERGYNQAALLVSQITRIFNIPDWSHLLRRHRATDRQSMQTGRDARMMNLSGAFSLASNMSKMTLPVLLIDDILTTGITLIEAAKPMREEGIEVTGLVVASDHR